MPLHSSHVAYTNAMESVVIRPADIIVHGFKLLDMSNRLTQFVRTKIAADDDVRSSWGRSIDALFLPQRL